MFNNQFQVGDQFICNSTGKVLTITSIFQEPDQTTEYTLSINNKPVIDVCINALSIEYTQLRK